MFYGEGGKAELFWCIWGSRTFVSMRGRVAKVSVGIIWGLPLKPYHELLYGLIGKTIWSLKLNPLYLLKDKTEKLKSWCQNEEGSHHYFPQKLGIIWRSLRPSGRVTFTMML